MNPLLRVEMTALSVLVVGVLFRAVNRGKLRMQYALLWLVVAAAMVLAALFPGVVYWLCGIMGVETPSNLVYLFAFVALLAIAFHHTVVLSEQSERIKGLTQMLSIERFLAEEARRAGETDQGEEGGSNESQ